MSGKKQDPKVAEARAAKRADQKASAPVVGERQNIVWTVQIESAGVRDWLVAAPFRPTVGFSLEVGRKPAVLARITSVSEGGPPVPAKWGGRASIVVSPDRTRTFKVAIKSQQGDKDHQLKSALLPGYKKQQAQGAYKAPATAAVLKTPPRFWGLRLGSRDAEAWWIARTRMDPIVGDRVDGEATSSVLQVVGPIPQPSKTGTIKTCRLQRPGMALQACTLSWWEPGNPTIQIGTKTYDGNRVSYPGTTPVAARPDPKPAAARTTPASTAVVAAVPVEPKGRAPSTSLSVLAGRAATALPSQLLGFLQRLGALDTDSEKLRAAELAAVTLEESPPVRMLLAPQGQMALDLVEKAFPGVRAAIGQVPAGSFQALANGASDLARRKYKVDAYYRTCLSWAEGAHYMGGGWRGPAHPTWAVGRGETTRAQSPSGMVEIPGPKSACDHRPEDCNCLGHDVSDKILMFGMDETIKPADVARWVRRYSRVLCIVPNPAFIYFQGRLEKLARIITIPGDPGPIRLPADRWFGQRTTAKVPAWFWQPRQDLVWQRQALGAAFVLAEFGVIGGSRGYAPASVLGLLSRTWSPVLEGDLYTESDIPVCRRQVVETAAASLAGRPLADVAWETAERTASRVVRENPGPFEAAAEIRAAADIAWSLTAQARHQAWPAAWFTSLLWPLAAYRPHGHTRPWRDITAAVSVLAFTAAAVAWCPKALKDMGLAAVRRAVHHVALRPYCIDPVEQQFVAQAAQAVGGLVFATGVLTRRWIYAALALPIVSIAAYGFALFGIQAHAAGNPPLDFRLAFFRDPVRARATLMSVAAAHEVAFWRDVVVAPILEEFVKHSSWGGLATLAILAVETWRDACEYRELDLGMALRRASANTIHVMAHLLPFDVAVLLHAMWNLNAWVWEHQAPRRPP